MDEYCTWDVGSVWHRHWPEFMYICQLPIFHAPVSLPYILRSVCWTNAKIGILVPCDAKIYLINCMWVSDLHFMEEWFCHILKTTWWINVVLEILIQCEHWTETIYVGQWPIFHGPVILPYILKTIWWTNFIIGILDPCDAKIYHIKCMWVGDLHFMVQWFCLISWRLFDGLISQLDYWIHMMQRVTI